eukprot:Gregarina_sp_Pseudo_9__2340@NODE_2652_length_922_cov_326_261608_g2432_i0_p1_GENE_NODE_2652_length_922_cov_326_261608_g2432_i0NODE_2652_length_922_cov_326_261608_g2432_i0_p1_ORF_typecomplete_len266_score57_55Chromo/PF00385_24/1_5e15Chromo_shadow/PF01393_19/4_4Chromo_shadow/PF01393_19/1_5e02_NODE_2652_length_922_cov_326_261608_g2432_i0124834
MADCTWEPEENIQPPELVAKFKQHGEGKKKRRGAATEPREETSVSKPRLRAKKTAPVEVHDSVTAEETETVSVSSATSPTPEVLEVSPASAETTSSLHPGPVSVTVSTETPVVDDVSASVPVSSEPVSSEAVSTSAWISGDEVSHTSPKPTVPPNSSPLISDANRTVFDESRWRVEHLGPPPYKGTPGHWALVTREDGVEEYIPISTVRQFLPNRLFDYLLARIQFTQEQEEENSD